MLYTILKFVISAFLLVLISELAKKNTHFAALIAALPIISILAMIWLYHDTGDTHRISALSIEIFWLVIPSLTFFVTFSWLLRLNLHFYMSLGIAMTITALVYRVFVMIPFFRH